MTMAKVRKPALDWFPPTGVCFFFEDEVAKTMCDLRIYTHPMYIYMYTIKPIRHTYTGIYTYVSLCKHHTKYI